MIENINRFAGETFTLNDEETIIIDNLNVDLLEKRMLCGNPYIKNVFIISTNIIKIPNILNFTAQAIRVKQIQKRYKAKMVIVDGNGLGSGLVDELLKESIDPMTGENLGCWDTINDDNTPEIPFSPKIVYNLKAQSCQNEVVTTFIDMVDSGKLKLLEKRSHRLKASYRKIN